VQFDRLRGPVGRLAMLFGTILVAFIVGVTTGSEHAFVAVFAVGVVLSFVVGMVTRRL
jgi:hypothetical protein